ncbi:MAG: DUF389 domain-containing protein, partial [Chloroflexota bacterium]|nr:DUF389 domain-containing protein [Chloroflexota bacterium]
FELLVSVIGLIFLLMTILVFIRDLVKPRASLPDHRGLKLPFHPLVPALAVLVSIYFSIAYDLQIWMVILGWGMLGLIFYLAYARRGSLAVRKQTQIMGEEIPRYAEKDFRILVDVTSAKDELSLIRAGITMAQSGDGQVLIMQVLEQIQHMPVKTESRAAEKALLVLKNKVHQIENDGVPIETLVRLAPSRPSGILETVREENIDLVLMGWSGTKQRGEEMLDADINRLIQTAPCDVAVLRGEYAGPIRSVTVSTRGGPHAGEALKYGRWLAEQQDGQVVALNIVRGVLTAEKRAQAERQLNQAINDAGEPKAYLPRVVMAGDVKVGIVKESVDSDLLLMGVSTHGLLDQAVLDGIPVEVARARTGATLLVKHHEGTGQFWLRRAWEMIYSFFPTLTVGERTEVDRRIKRSAMASVDFYALITLSAVIAVLGLIQDSGAVIIGAMLVAPLMSPILAMAFSLVLGDVRMLAQSGESTLKGILLAIVVAVVIALVIPPLPISAQILARTQPNLLDLIVALASGAAAAYALARKHLAAALPGVAIAAALVPPLCVVGYGLGYGMYGVAGGALLLFATNLSAIVLSGATVFLLLGFRPDRAEYGQRIQRWILLTVAVLLIIATPLALATINLRSNLDRQQEVKSVLNDAIQAEFAEVEDVTIKQQGDGYLIGGTVYSYGEITDEELVEVQALLSEEIGAPVIIRARIINAKLRIVGGERELDVLPSP